ncbi:hypothetical protein AJ80_05158 [Polytolypa hystricis UAMH7299]|uniref:Carboxymuconolactone decarboxylase-like domain-containing protein n=1 Tax=Polytolypa hystricis (strain UAMH7299) TaxID=1447883 RepID=A0A2B7Y5A5_POLH7|nr:hypothetical protein AJ80_05158 [Polytolypa hystricis UAMH7299]
MSRFPPIPPNELTPEQKEGHDEMDALAQQTFGSTFTLKNEEGALLGPFAPLLYTPTLVKPWLHLSHQVLTLPILSPRERELAVFAVLARTQANYAVYAHTKLCEKIGFSAAQISAAKAGEVPEGVSEREREAYVFAKELAGLKGGPLAAEVFGKARDVLGREGAAAVMHTVGSFLYASVLLNAADVEAPGS